MEPTCSDAWFETFARPDDVQTAREIAFLLSVLPAPPASVLDVPCGFGATRVRLLSVATT